MSIQLKAMPFDSKEILDESTGETTYDRVAYSKDLADWLRSYFSNGILVPGGNTLGEQLKVSKKDGAQLSVKPGAIVINGRTGWVEKEEELTVDVGGSSHRIDRIVAELNIPSDRGIYLKVLKGNPSAPSLTTTEDVYQIPLAQVRVNAGASVIAEVTDERANHISNVLIGIKPPTGNDASAVAVSDEVKKIYKLSESERNVDDALKKLDDDGSVICSIFLARSSGDALDVAWGSKGPILGHLGRGLLKYIKCITSSADKYQRLASKRTLEEILEDDVTRGYLGTVKLINLKFIYMETWFAFQKIVPIVLSTLSESQIQTHFFHKAFIEKMVSSHNNTLNTHASPCFFDLSGGISVDTKYFDLRYVKKLRFKIKKYSYDGRIIVRINGHQIYEVTGSSGYNGEPRIYEVEIPNQFKIEQASISFSPNDKIHANLYWFAFS